MTNYCLSVKLEAAPEPVLVFKHTSAYAARAGADSDGAPYHAGHGGRLVGSGL